VRGLRFAYIFPLALVAGCVTSGGSDTVKQVSSDIALNSYRQHVNVTGSSSDMPPDFSAIFTSNVLQTMKSCAMGAKPLDLNVQISEFHIRNIAKTWIIGDSNVIAGSATLVDPATGSVVGDYDVKHSVGGGGLIAAAGMSNAPVNLSKDFGEELCEKAFSADAIASGRSNAAPAFEAPQSVAAPATVAPTAVLPAVAAPSSAPVSDAVAVPATSNDMTGGSIPPSTQALISQMINAH
jgi:hypothetical protein